MIKQGPIVVVDDDADDQYLYQQALQQLNLPNEIVFFSNGRDALEYLSQAAIDPFIILCDINMPLMNGLELRESIISSEMLRKKNTPFIFMSTSARQGDIERAASLYTHGFFQKEASYKKHEDLLRKIISYWESSRSVGRQAA